MPKTPDEIKKGLECCARVGCCHTCPYDGECHSSHDDPCQMHMDALALIQQLEDHLRETTKKVGQLEAERDAAVKAIFNLIPSCYLCDYCKHSHPINICPNVDQCEDYAKWEWRGVQKEDAT